MAIVTLRLGSSDNVLQYDDADFDSAIETTAPMKAGAPVDPNDVVILGGLPALATVVSSTAVLTDHSILRGDGGARGIQDSGIIIDDSDNITGVVDLTLTGNITLSDDKWIGIGAALERIVFDAAGDISVMGANFGIGTDSPEASLHISGTGILFEGASDNLEGKSNVDFIAFRNTAGPTGTTRAFGFYTSSGVAQLLSILNNGNVGIGTGAPTLPLSSKELIGWTPIGGLAIKLTNKTGSNTVAGQLVRADTATDDGFILSSVTTEHECFGVVLESGIANNAEAWIIVSGIADVAMRDNTAATHGNWVFTSSEAGYADATLAAPTLGGVAQLDQHMQEVGHCIESISATGGGTYILARCVLQFN